MKTLFNKMLGSFDYAETGDFLFSLFPALKYNLCALALSFSFLLSCIDKTFGLSAASVLALIVVMILEICSGIFASHIKGEDFSSRKLSRFTFKMACYLVLIAVPYLFYTSFKAREQALAASLFEWLHVFLVIQIVIENIISILENVAVIQGKPKTFWIDKIRRKTDNIL